MRSSSIGGSVIQSRSARTFLQSRVHRRKRPQSEDDRQIIAVAPGADPDRVAHLPAGDLKFATEKGLRAAVTCVGLFGDALVDDLWDAAETRSVVR